VKPLLLALLLAGSAPAESDGDALVERILRSPVAENITRETDPDLRRETLKDWILSNPESAAQLAEGLAQDDAEGSTRYQDMIRRPNSILRYNPGSEKNVYSRLRKSGTDSKLLGKQSEQLSEEEKREILKTMFEGRGGQNRNILTQQDGGKSPESPAGTAAAAGLGGQGYFDRLGQGNLRGYSPELMAMQSALNARRPPGAPKLIESGKLDYATLSYPAYGMRFDVANLETRLAKAAEAGLDPLLLEKRRRTLGKAALAMKEFDQAALAAQDPAKISKTLLVALGDKQREAARWITAASLDEELRRLEGEEGFLSAELLALIDACPFPEATRRAYKRRGEGFLARLREMKANAAQALALLESDAWLSSVGRVEKTLAQNAVLRKDLLRNIRDFVNTPYRLVSAAQPRPRWRRLLDDLLMRWLPSHPYARKLKRQADQKAMLGDVFLKIAGGDLDAAHTVLASFEAR
jgi:hypothetical protein